MSEVRLYNADCLDVLPSLSGIDTVVMDPPFIESLNQASVPRVGDLFEIHLGIRTGLNSVFLLSEAQLRALRAGAEERKYFRPVADNDTIRDSRVRSSLFVFYPYGLNGQLRISSESELESAVPEYYSRYLSCNRERLEGRKSIRGRKWWELSEPRLSWQPQCVPKIVSPCFGQSGRFALDMRGRYCVVQGFAWAWRRGPLDDHYLYFAYLALLNSRAFEGFLRFFCPLTRAGQFSLYPHHVGRVFLPDLSDISRVPSDLTDELSRLGRRLAEGNKPDSPVLDSVAHRVYTATSVRNPLAFLWSELYALSKYGQLDAATDRVIGFFEDAMTMGAWNDCEIALKEADVTALDPSVSLTFLSMTFAVRDKLRNRQAYYDRLRQFLLCSHSESEVRRLLKGLE